MNDQCRQRVVVTVLGSELADLYRRAASNLDARVRFRRELARKTQVSQEELDSLGDEVGLGVGYGGRTTASEFKAQQRNLEMQAQTMEKRARAYRWIAAHIDPTDYQDIDAGEALELALEAEVEA